MNDIFDTIVSDFDTKDRAVALYYSGPMDGKFNVARIAEVVGNADAVTKVIASLGKKRDGTGAELFWGTSAECRAIAGRLVSFGLAARVQDRTEEAGPKGGEAKSSAQRDRYINMLRRSGPAEELAIAPVNLVRWDDRLRCVVTVNKKAVEMLSRYTGAVAFRALMSAAYSDDEIQQALDIYHSKSDVPDDDVADVLHEALRDFKAEEDLLQEIAASKQASGGMFVSPQEAASLLRIQERMLNISATDSKKDRRTREHFADARRELLLLALDDEDFREKSVGSIPAADLAEHVAHSVREYTQRKLYEIELFLRPV